MTNRMLSKITEKKQKILIRKYSTGGRCELRFYHQTTDINIRRRRILSAERWKLLS
jgi:hypothetical protein